MTSLGWAFSVTCAKYTREELDPFSRLLIRLADSTVAAVGPDASRCVSIVSSVDLEPEICPATLARRESDSQTDNNTSGPRVTQRQGRARGQDERRAVQLLVHIQVHYNR